MPSYQIYFDTQNGEVNNNVDIDDHEVLREVLHDILSELEESGHILRGRTSGSGDVVCRWEGRDLDFNTPLKQQGVRSNDVLRVGIKSPSIQLRRDGRLYNVKSREEIRHGDDVILGHTMLRFQVKNEKNKIDKRQTLVLRLQDGRSFQQTAYYMSLVGAMAGIGTWFIYSLIRMALTIDLAYYDLVTFVLLGSFIGGLSVAFNDSMSGGGIVPRWVLIGVGSGAIAGIFGGLVAMRLKGSLVDAPHLADSLSWLVTGTLIGGGVCMRWYETNRSRVFHGMLGGMAGGFLGGLAYTWIATFRIGDYAQALGLALTGAGIMLGISLAPVLLRHGVLEFVNSRDHNVLKKYSASRKQWEILQSGKYVIGSLSAKQTVTIFSPELNIFIPDRAVEPRHAVLTSHERKYYIEPHPELTMGRIVG